MKQTPDRQARRAESTRATVPPGEVHRDVVCTVCGCVCDDLQVTLSAPDSVELHGACSLAEPWWRAALSVPATPDAVAFVEQRPVPLEEACRRAAEMLCAAQAPLIYGLSRSSTAGQRAAVLLADRLGATIDTTASRCHAPSIMALQEVGESTCTLGEVANRADLVVYWGSNPVESHPRHLERYGLEPRGEFVPRGRLDRRLAVVDVRPTATSAEADLFVRVRPGCDFEALWSLQALVRGERLEPGRDLGAERADLVRLAEWMRQCRYGVVFFGLGLTRGSGGHRQVEALLRLVRDLNRYTRFSARRMRVPGDVAGADSVLAWLTGYPFSVNLSRGYPRYNPGEYSANELLERDEVDACLLVGSEGVAALSTRAASRLRSLPTIVLDYPHLRSDWAAGVRFTTAVYGIHRRGTAYRMDEIPLPLRTLVPSGLPDDAEVLSAIADLCRPT